MTEPYSAVVTTTDSADEAAQLMRGIVEARLGACGQIVGPIRSFYWWEGKVQDAQEWQCWMKTTTDKVEALTDYIKKHHSYDVPEVVAMPITSGNADYLTWITDETRSV